MRPFLCVLLIPCLLFVSSVALYGAPASAPAQASAPGAQAQPQTQNESAEAGERRDGRLILEGEEVFPLKESLLMRELGQEHSHTSRARRWEIVFFISIPVTLLLGFSLMEGLSRNVPDELNEKRELRQPHYIYMFSTALITSLYISIQDVRRYHPPEKTSSTSPARASGLSFELPLWGVRF